MRRPPSASGSTRWSSRARSTARAAAIVGPDDAGRGTRAEDDALPDTDILVTTSSGVTLAILVADCVPLALVDPAAHVLAAVHAGWRGTAGGAVAAALGAMEAHGARAERVRAFIGPAVAPGRYQVGDEVPTCARAARHVPDVLDTGVARADGAGPLARRPRGRQPATAPRRRCRPTAHVDDSGVTTDDDAFFSDRARRPCGRFALFARLLD